ASVWILFSQGMGGICRTAVALSALASGASGSPAVHLRACHRLPPHLDCVLSMEQQSARPGAAALNGDYIWDMILIPVSSLILS
ncbi:hypothetical protein ACT9CX_004489, partial [Shigella sonnei]